MNDKMEKYRQDLEKREYQEEQDSEKYEIQIYSSKTPMLSDERLTQICIERGLRPYQPPPELTPRAEINRIIQGTAAKVKNKKRKAEVIQTNWVVWRFEIKDRMHVDLKRRADGAGCDPLDIAESLGEDFMLKALAITRKVFMREKK